MTYIWLSIHDVISPISKNLNKGIDFRCCQATYSSKPCSCLSKTSDLRFKTSIDIQLDASSFKNTSYLLGIRMAQLLLAHVSSQTSAFFCNPRLWDLHWSPHPPCTGGGAVDDRKGIWISTLWEKIYHPELVIAGFQSSKVSKNALVAPASWRIIKLLE